MSEGYLAPALREPDEAEGEVAIVSAVDFAAVDEPGAEALLGTEEANLIPAGGDAMIYGDGGVGKTTLAIDLACHLAIGHAWLGVPVARPVCCLLIEAEGPRPLFRRKLARKLDAWPHEAPGERLRVWEAPWNGFRFDDDEMRAQLARAIFEQSVDLVIAGPVANLGMDEAGTMAEVRAFAALVASVRERSLRPVASLLVHHESKSGRVSGAWEGVGDTMLHVQGSGHGRTRLFVQKARWGSAYHATTLRLEWLGEGGFELADEDEATIAERTYDDILRAIRENPGTGWSAVAAVVKGADAYLAKRRDKMLGEGVIVDLGPGSAGDRGHRFALWLADDPARPKPLEGLEESAAPRRLDADSQSADPRRLDADSHSSPSAGGHEIESASLRARKGADSISQTQTDSPEDDIEW
jgi:hypothetical protein